MSTRSRPFASQAELLAVRRSRPPALTWFCITYFVAGALLISLFTAAEFFPSSINSRSAPLELTAFSFLIGYIIVVFFVAPFGYWQQRRWSVSVFGACFFVLFLVALLAGGSGVRAQWGGLALILPPLVGLVFGLIFLERLNVRPATQIEYVSVEAARRRRQPRPPWRPVGLLRGMVGTQLLFIALVFLVLGLALAFDTSSFRTNLVRGLVRLGAGGVARLALGLCVFTVELVALIWLWRLERRGLGLYAAGLGAALLTYLLVDRGAPDARGVYVFYGYQALTLAVAGFTLRNAPSTVGTDGDSSGAQGGLDDEVA